MASALAPKLTCLRELALMAHGLDSVKLKVLDEITSPLETLSISGWHADDDEPIRRITRHGATLRQLKIHEKQRDIFGHTRGFLAARDLIQLGGGLPHLEELAIDIARGRQDLDKGSDDADEWPYEALDAIARFPHLRTVEFWFPLGVHPVMPRPFLNVSSASHLFGYIRGQNDNIQRLTLHSGLPYQQNDFTWGIPEYPRTFIEYYKVTFICTMAYDGGSGESRISITYPRLSRDMNGELNRLAQQAEPSWRDLGELNLEELHLEAAFNRPLTGAVWEAWVEERTRHTMRQEAAERQKRSLKRKT